jgi:four helix bundle protein
MDVFKLSHSLTIEVYKLTERFPIEERFGLSAQMRRSAYSIPSQTYLKFFKFNSLPLDGGG